VKDKEELIVSLIFGEQTEYSINISEYIQELYKYDRFIDEIKSILKKSKVNIINENLELDSNGPIWIIKVKK
jgi:hypothetical protein